MFGSAWSFIALVFMITPFAAHAEEEIHYTALGDSITYGLGASQRCTPASPVAVSSQCSSAKNYAALLALALNKETPVVFQNLGICGAKIDDVLKKELPHLTPQATLVTLYIGTNDVLGIVQSGAIQHGYDHFKAAYALAIEKIHQQAPQARIILANVPNSSFMPYLADSSAEEKQNLDRIARLINSEVINPYTKTGISVVDRTCDARAYSNNYLEDKLHPNDAGHQLLSDGFLQAYRHSVAPASPLSCSPYL